MDAVNEVLSQSPDDPDGRSQWVWVRLPNGDLILGVLPQGDTYFNVEHYVERDLHAAEKGEPPLLDIDRIVENLKRWVDG